MFLLDRDLAPASGRELVLALVRASARAVLAAPADFPQATQVDPEAAAGGAAAQAAVIPERRVDLRASAAGRALVDRVSAEWADLVLAEWEA
jgi:hypothetical protein